MNNGGVNLRNWLQPLERRREKKRVAERLRSVAEGAKAIDPQENAASTPPENEEVRLQAVWLAESYPAAYSDPLLDKLRLLAGGKSGTTARGAEAVAWLEEALRSGGAGWASLGAIVTPGSDLFAHTDPIEIELPPGVRYALGGVHLFVPSHALLVVCFVLDELASKRVENVLRAYYHTYGVPHGRWTTIHGPFNQKCDAVRAERRAQLEELGSFFERHLPGLFSASESFGSTLPSIEFWTTKQVKPFDEDRHPVTLDSMHSFIQTLDWRRSMDAWEAPDGLTLIAASTTGDRHRNVHSLQLVARECELFASDDLQAWGGRDQDGYINRLSYGVNGLLAVWAFNSTTRFYESEMIALRQRLRLGQRQSPRRRVRGIHEVHEHLLDQRSDVEALARGVARAKDVLLVNFRSRSFDLSRWLPPHLREPSDDELRQQPESRLRRLASRLVRRGDDNSIDEGSRRRLRSHRYSWLEVQALEISERAEELHGTSREIGEIAVAMVEATSAQANLRLQRQIAILTWLLAIVGVVTLVVAFAALR
jgi:hypothetical protein